MKCEIYITRGIYTPPEQFHQLMACAVTYSHCIVSKCRIDEDGAVFSLRALLPLLLLLVPASPACFFPPFRCSPPPRPLPRPGTASCTHCERALSDPFVVIRSSALRHSSHLALTPRVLAVRSDPRRADGEESTTSSHARRGRMHSGWAERVDPATAAAANNAAARRNANAQCETAADDGTHSARPTSNPRLTAAVC